MQDPNRGPGFRLRRRRTWAVLRGILAALVVWGLGWSVGALAQFAPAPDHLQVAAPHVGDAATYSYQLTKQTLVGKQTKFASPQGMSFRWLDPRQVLDANGTDRVVDVADVRLPALSMEDHVVIGFMPDFPDAYRVAEDDRFYGANGRLVALHWQETYHGRHEYDQAGQHVVQQDDRVQNDTTFANHVEGPQGEHFSAFDTPCGLRSRAQVEALPLGSEVHALGRCWLAGTFYDDPVLSSDGAERRAGETCVWFKVQEVAGTHARLLFCPSVPYPIDVVLTYDGHEGFEARYHLDAFQRGNHPLGAVDPSPLAPADVPSLEQSPIQPWGLDDDGVDHPFPASHAYKALMADPAAASIPAERRLTSVGFSETDSDAGANRTWRFAWRTPDELVSATVSQTPPGAAVVAVHVSPATDSHNPWTNASAIAALWNASTPPQAPTVLSLEAAWRVVSASPLPLNTWGFWLTYSRCGGWLGPGEHDEQSWSGVPCDFQWHVTAGHHLVTRTGQEGVDGTEDRRKEVATFDLDGRATSLASSHDVVVWRSNGTLPPGTPDTPPTIGMVSMQAPDFTVDHTKSWILAGSVLVGLVVAAWPSLHRFGAAALFSRVERGTALQQPTRAALYALVEAEPGIHYQELRRRADVSNHAADHHLRKLVGVGLVQQVVGNGYACYFPRGAMDRRLMAALPHAKGTRADVLAAVARQPQAPGDALAANTGLDPGTLSYHLKRLRRAGLVESRRVGRVKLSSPTALGLDVLRVHMGRVPGARAQPGPPPV